MYDSPVLVVYNTGWPRRFGQERDRIVTALGAAVGAVEHIGSTAVPGLSARPIIDIAIGIASLSEGERCSRSLEGLGYHHVDTPEPFGGPSFWRRTDGGHAYQIHLVQLEDTEWDDHLRVRDYLRSYAEEAGRYELLKRVAAKWGYRLYQESKGTFIEAVVHGAGSGEPTSSGR